MMEEMMKQCCGQGGEPNFERMKKFMEKCGKEEFAEGDIKMMKEFCGQGGTPDFEKMKKFMESRGSKGEKVN